MSSETKLASPRKVSINFKKIPNDSFESDPMVRRETLELVRIYYSISEPKVRKQLSEIIKSVADTTDKLMDLQKKIKDVNEDSPAKTNNVTNNALFVGSTSELSKMLKKGFLNNKEEK